MEKITAKEVFEYLSMLHPEAKCALDYKDDYTLLVSIVLSAQTTDKSVNDVTKILFKKYETINDLANASLEEVNEIIKPLGLSKAKSKNIISLSKKLVQDGYENVPNDFEYLIGLDGVGRKTANVFLSEFYNENTLGVDTHIDRISKRLKFAKTGDSVLEVEKKLKRAFAGYEYRKLHHILIFFGRNECKAMNPKCDSCAFNGRCKRDATK